MLVNHEQNIDLEQFKTISQNIIEVKENLNTQILNKREEIKSLLKEILYNSLAQAIIKIFLSPFILIKLILFIFVVVSISLAAYLVISSIMTYFAYGVSTTSRIIYETPTLFPKVTFCNLNPITTEYGYGVIKSGQAANIDFFSIEDQKKTARNLNEILLNCSFKQKPCNSSNFVWSYDPYFGNCFVFNSGFDSNGNRIDLEKSTLSGFYLGLQLTLYVNIYEKLFDYGNFNGLGAIFLIGNSSYLAMDNPILVTPGLLTYITVDREFNSILPKPYSNCDIDSTFKSNSSLFNLISKSKYLYTQQLCLTQCFQQYLIDNYNCTLSILFKMFNVTNVCNDKAFVDIEDSYLMDSLFKICLQLCPLECNQTLYKTSLSSSYLTGHKYISQIQNSNLSTDFINRTIDAATARESIVQVNIFYQSLSYSESTESPQINIVSLLGSMGGNLGLFLGVSVFSLGEIVEVFIEIYYILRRK